MGCGFTFIHCADLHLGSRFWGISEKDPGLGARLADSTFASFANIVDLGLEKADFMVIAGDIYDELTETPRTRVRFAKELERFGKPVYLVTGNHDPSHSWSDSIPYPENVHQFGTEASSEILEVNGTKVEIVGISFPGLHTDENLVSKIRGTPGMFTIGVVHGSVSTVGDGAGYAPFGPDDLLGKDVDYWALGHIHKRMVLRSSPPVAVYPGNIQGRNISEDGEKGCYLVTVADRQMSLRFVPTQQVVWKEADADITGLTTLSELADRVAKDVGSNCMAALNFTGRGSLDGVVRSDPEAVAAMVGERTGASVTVRRIGCGPDIDLEAAAQGDTLISEIVRAADRYAQYTDEELLDILCPPKTPASDLRIYLEWYAKKGELRKMVRQAELAAVGRVSGGSE